MNENAVATLPLIAHRTLTRRHLDQCSTHR